MVTVQDIIKDCRDAAHTYKGFDRPVEPASVVAIYERIAASLERVLAQRAPEAREKEITRLATIEECARVADAYGASVEAIAADIRSLSLSLSALTSTNGR